jgi:RHS repeat-associated protein
MNPQVKLDLIVVRRLLMPILTVVFLFSGAQAQTSNITDGTTPPGIAPGAPAGSYPLTEIEVLNVYNGNASLRFPLIKVGGRGAAQHTVTLPVEQRWTVDHFTDFLGQLHHSPQGTWWYTPGGYVGGRLLARYASDPCPQGSELAYTLTRVTFAGPDGTEYELRDTLTDGDKRVSNCDIFLPKFNRGRVFKTADGTAATFIADADVYDSIFSGFIAPMTGYLMLRDGTRYRFDNGDVTWIRDRNGNKISFSYGSGSTTIVDSLNRQILIEYNVTEPSPYGLCDRISFTGFGGADRIIRISKKSLSQVLRTTQPGDSATVKTYQQLFPELDAAYANDFNPSDKIASVWLPDGRRYEILYNVYGEVARVVLPTGGAMEYDWEGGMQGGSISGVTGFEIYRKVINRRIYADGAGSILEGKTTYSKTSNSSTSDVTVEQKDTNDTVLARSKHYFYTNPSSSLFAGDPFGYATWKDGKESQTEALNSTGTVLRRQTNTWQQRAPVSWWIGSPDLAPPNDPRITETVFSLVDTNQVAKQTFTYSNDLHNNRTDVYEFDYGQGGPPLYPTRHTHTNYVTTNPVNGLNYAGPANGSSYTISDYHLRMLPMSQFVYAVNPSTGVETLAAKAEYEYDRYDATTNHAPLLNRMNISGLHGSFTTNYEARGNVTEIKRWLDTSDSWVTIDQQYDIAGNIVKKVDARGKVTDIDFSDRFGAPNGDARANTSPPELSSASQTSFAFPTSVTNPLQHTAYTQYDYYIGRAVDLEDERGVIDSGFYNDLLDRATQLVEATNTSDNRQTTYTYNDPARIVTTTTDQNTYGDNQLKAETLYDGLGREVEARHYETTNAFIATQQTYDAMGRVRQVSNPHRSGDTVFWTVTAFDALGRKITVTTPDQAQATISYSGNTSTFTDQAGKKRATTKDALGRLVSATEDPLGQNLQTSYTYNALDKLTRATQGSQIRDYSFDTLGRLTLATIPEQIGSTSYSSYDANSNLTTRTDPRGVETTYVYDDLNRITSVSYNTMKAPDVAATPNVSYSYDSPSVLYSKGELTGVSVSLGDFSSSYSYDEYDPRGRVKRSSQTTDGHAYAFTYGYDVAGHLTSETYPSGRVITTSYDGAGRINIVNGSGRTTPYAEQFSYTAHGEVKDMKLGNGLWEHTISNNRLQLTEIGLGTTQGGIDRLKLNYDYGSTTNNGNLLSQTITVPGYPALTIVQNYSYNDGLNRLTSAQETASQTVRWTQSYVYDRYGNRTSLTNTGSEAALLPTQSTPAVTATTNRLVGFSYDNAGNVLMDATSNEFEYDAENRQVSAGTSSYSYDGDGLRVRKVVNGVTTIFVYDALQRLVAEYTTPDQQPQGGGGTSFLTSDHLGSTRLVTDSTGNVKSRHDYMPFGDELEAGIGSRTAAMKYGAADGLRQKFTGKQRDTESGLDYFGARYYSSPHARFTGVDPLMESAHLAMPQTWNRFAYVLNNPLVIIDPNGEGWVQVGDKIGWVEGVDSQEDADNWAKRRKIGKATFLPLGTIKLITGGNSLAGQMVILTSAAQFIPLGKPRPIPIREIEWYGGDGERFLLAYFKFAAENIVLSAAGAKLMDGIEALIQLAKAKRAGKAALEVLEAAKKAEGVCFALGTMVVTTDGDKPIEELKEGDEVLCTSDPECGEPEWQRVTRVFERSASELVDIRLAGVIISCTPEHPFWLEGRGWAAAEELKQGTELRSRAGSIVRVESLDRREGQFIVYNLEVENLHNYYVSSLGLLVHNQCAAGGRIDPRKVRFAQDSIASTFQDGRSIEELAQGLRNGTINPADIPPIRLVEREGALFTLDNRRLEAFQRAGVDIPYRMATASEAAAEGWKFTTTTGGTSVRIRR